jgi:8-oxo-dGTP pyrophosphatase MutT (NUDIX family)
MKLLREINLESLPKNKLDTIKFRQAARAVVFDDERNLALLHVSNLGYYKLPGGGLDEGESMLQALKRECLEEIGCEIEVEQEVGLIVEYREKFNLKQESYCYIAHVLGKKGVTALTPPEIAQGFKLMWVPLRDAVRLVSESNSEDYQGLFIVPRDLAFLRETERILSGPSE